MSEVREGVIGNNSEPSRELVEGGAEEPVIIFFLLLGWLVATIIMIELAVSLCSLTRVAVIGLFLKRWNAVQTVLPYTVIFCCCSDNIELGPIDIVGIFHKWKGRLHRFLWQIVLNIPQPMFKHINEEEKEAQVNHFGNLPLLLRGSHQKKKLARFRT